MPIMETIVSKKRHFLLRLKALTAKNIRSVRITGIRQIIASKSEKEKRSVG